MPDDDHSAISASDAKGLFAEWKAAPALVLAVSGGPDSVALMWLAARWRRAFGRGPRLIAVTVDHGLRPASAREANDVKRLAQEPWPAAPHPALARRQAGNRIAGRGAGRALPAAGKGRAGSRRQPYPHRAYPRRPGRDAVDAAVARQRHRRSCGDGARNRRAMASCWRVRCCRSRRRG